uniref:Uncharacterized protein n=1 Tax=Meloidogyne enterolobii TaxID=390850 RepID=A0A6V7VZ03_MELEN|nr:unnamed protein product [Meloidogyne enterolobii]
MGYERRGKSFSKQPNQALYNVQPKYKIVLKTKKYEGLVWLMQSLAFCSILESTQKKLPYGGRSPEFHRDFQMNLLKAAFALV